MNYRKFFTTLFYVFLAIFMGGYFVVISKLFVGTR